MGIKKAHRGKRSWAKKGRWDRHLAPAVVPIDNPRQMGFTRDLAVVLSLALAAACVKGARPSDQVVGPRFREPSTTLTAVRASKTSAGGGTARMTLSEAYGLALERS